MSVTYFRAKNTQNIALTSTAVSVPLASPNTTQYFRITGDRRFHILIDKTGANATTDDLFVPAECVNTFRVDIGEGISIIRADGETDGNVWVTPQS